tara:strand:- start:99 stop:266 length:168 start_codon:yes stop_codon:yes gene_type:complete
MAALVFQSTRTVIKAQIEVTTRVKLSVSQEQRRILEEENAIPINNEEERKRPNRG